MRAWLAALAAIWMSAVGCGNGSAPNGRVAPNIVSTPPGTATLGVPYNYTVMVEGMTPIGFAVVSGPAGFEVHPTSGIVTWVPSEPGRAAITISASNLAGEDTQAFSVEVESLSSPVFTTVPPAEATVAAPYAYDPMVVAEGDVAWSAPTAPRGLSIDPETGAVRWTPDAEQVGEQEVVIRATAVESGRSTAQAFTVAVIDTGGPATITSTPPKRVYQGELWRYEATAAGAPTIEWTLVAPANGVPAEGVTIVTSPPEGGNVVVEWETASVPPGDYSVALRVTNGLGEPDTQETVVTVDPRPPVPEIDLVTMPPPSTMFVGALYEYDVALRAGTDSPGVVFSLVGDALPPDLPITIDSDTGVVRFTASDSNGEMEYGYTVRAENVLGEGDEETIRVRAVYPPAAPVLTVTPDTAFTLEVGERFPGASATATGNPTPVLSISGTLPDFLEFDPITGLLSASSSKPTPVEEDIGEYSFDIVATSSEGADTATIDISVMAAPPVLDSITPAAGRRQSSVPVVVRGAGFVSTAAPTIRLELGAHSETLATTFVDAQTLTATVPIDPSRPAGVYDVVVDQGSISTLAKRFTVTEGDGSMLRGAITRDTLLTALASPHVVIGDVRIGNGATLTVEAGAVVMFAGNSNLRIDVGVASAGALVADGGEPGVGEQIVFTRFQDVGAPAPSGHYRGLRFGANSISDTTELRNVVVEFAGRRNAATEQGAVEVLAGSAPRFHDSIIRESINYGLYAQAGAGSETSSWFDRNRLTANGRAPLSMGADDVSTLGASLDLRGNGRDRVFVRGSRVSRPNAAWANYGVPYYLSAGLVIRDGSTMNLEPGTEMRFAEARGLRVSTGGASGETGALRASGSPEAPIRMLADAGPWNGVHFDDNVQSGTVLRNVRVEGFSGSVDGGLRVDPGPRVGIVEGTVFQSGEPGSVGIYLANTARLSSFENNVVDTESLSIDAALPGFSDVVGASSVYEAPLRVRSSASAGIDMVWSAPVASDGGVQPIQPSGDLTVTNGSLLIAAGNRIEMPLDGQLAMIDSQLIVDGTPSAPVLFEPASGVPYWNRIRLHGAGAPGVSRITHAVLESAGSDPGLSAALQRAAVVVEANAGVPATPAISDTMILNSGGYGMTFANETHCGGACNDNTIDGARFSALRMFANFIGRFGAGNALGGNNTSGTMGHEGIWVSGDVIDMSATWPANDVPYVVQGNIELRQSYPLDPVPVLSIEPGAELRFANDRRLRVGEGNDGVLDARGTDANPITFTSIDRDSPAFWRGIELNQGSDGSTLHHVVVTHGGSAVGTGNVSFRSGSIATLGVARLSHSANYAAVIFPGSAPMFMGPPSDRIYELNGQSSNPGPGDPAFDCVRDVATSTCNPL
ncbi:MAG: putative Ig domain-containing protein [Deltaproteobacteria bacterium]|nr:putative Ig domain-containing protein [Deltaproteobacteria bacterium]